MTPQKLSDAALLLPILGLILLMPPFIEIFVGLGSAFGIPVIVLYIFGVWALLILGSFILSRYLTRLDRRRSSSTPPRPTDMADRPLGDADY